MSCLKHCRWSVLYVLSLTALLHSANAINHRFAARLGYSNIKKYCMSRQTNFYGNYKQECIKDDRMGLTHTSLAFVSSSLYKETLQKYYLKRKIKKEMKNSTFSRISNIAWAMDKNVANKRTKCAQNRKEFKEEQPHKVIQNPYVESIQKIQSLNNVYFRKDQNKYTMVNTPTLAGYRGKEVHRFNSGPFWRKGLFSSSTKSRTCIRRSTGNWNVKHDRKINRSNIILQMSNNEHPSDNDIKENELKLALGGPNLFPDTLKIILGLIFASISFSLLDQNSLISIPILHQINTQLFGILQNFRIEEFFHSVQNEISDLGVLGYVYFAFVYIIAELLAVPAIPLTASSGYLFGIYKGTGIVLVSATIAASLSFLIGRTLLRDTVKKWVDNYPKFKAFDNAIGKEGFKIILLLRLSPIFPFALSNYMYGLTAVEFWPYVFATCIGFTPGTIAYVYSGTVGKAISESNVMDFPWYYYFGIAGGFAIFVKVISDIAMDAIKEYEQSSDDDDMTSI